MSATSSSCWCRYKLVIIINARRDPRRRHHPRVEHLVVRRLRHTHVVSCRVGRSPTRVRVGSARGRRRGVVSRAVWLSFPRAHRVVWIAPVAGGPVERLRARVTTTARSLARSLARSRARSAGGADTVGGGGGGDMEAGGDTDGAAATTDGLGEETRGARCPRATVTRRALRATVVRLRATVLRLAVWSRDRRSIPTRHVVVVALTL